jgi:Fe-S cluster assembly iron-binding protein IscA
MIGVTERAKQELKNILTANVDNPQATLRLTAGDQGQLGLGIDIEQLGDQIVEHEGSKVLVVEEALATALEGVTLDVQDTDEGPKLVVSKEPES